MISVSASRTGRARTVLAYRIENEVGADTTTFEFEKGRGRTVEWEYFVD